MREIKFRAWDKGEKVMRSIEKLICVDGKVCGVRYDNYHDDPNDYEGIDYCELMQFTGLKDKNGKEIYEGDIVKFPTGVKAEVDFAVGSFQCRFDDGVGSPAALQNKLFEVIGNIFENKELLK